MERDSSTGSGSSRATSWGFALLLFAALATFAFAQRGQNPSTSGDNIILVTLDGARTEEVFGGLDLEIFRSTLKADAKAEDHPVYRRYWAGSREERRRKLMPFFWTLVTDQGSIAGDRQLDSIVKLGNRHWFSYPGYAEILLGEPHDDRIKSNDPIRNPYPTLLETIRARLNLPREKVAVFASWSVFNEIVEHTEGTIFANAGVEPLDSADPRVKEIDRLQREVPTPWEGTRFDAFTFRLAMAHLAAAKPRVLYLAFDETDDWAHDGRYDRVLDAYARTDEFLKELWTWVGERSGLPRPNAPARHDGSRPRANRAGLARPRIARGGVRRRLDGVRVAPDDAARRMAGRSAALHEPDRGDARVVGRSRLEQRASECRERSCWSLVIGHWSPVVGCETNYQSFHQRPRGQQPSTSD